MEVNIKKTDEKDFFETECLTREALWNVYKPGCDEHLVLNKIRKSKSYIPELDLVAVYEHQIIRHVISTKARVIDSMNIEHEVLCVGPISVLPALQNKGVGTKLINYSISEARNLGYVAMILFGNPDYYHRFGFRNAKEYKITTKDLQNFEPFMVLELLVNGLNKVNGRYFEDNAFITNQEELIEFEKKFPYKQKLKTKTQLE